MKHLIFFLILIFSGNILAEEGREPFVPSKLDWLALEMNVFSKSVFEENGIYMAFVGIENKNEILIYVRYYPDADRERLNRQVNDARRLIEVKAEGYGWSEWLKIKEDVKVEERK